ncbi:MAG: hypothetical protein FP816_16585 [Desulfobacteraceae bacterium]|nr:hypothetical protein [Desulfobacteraceae bacterium]
MMNTESVNSKALVSALIKILRPLVRILLRNGMSFVTFSNIAKRVYVDMAEEEFGLEGRKQSGSRISVLTGLSRKEVKRVMETTHPSDTDSGERYNRAARVIAAWRREKDFHDENGIPMALPLNGKDPSFSGLVRKFSGDLPFRAVLDELIASGNAEKTDDNRVKLISRFYIPRNEDNVKLHILGTDAAHLISTIDHNLQSVDSERFFQRKVSYDNLPQEVLPVFQEMVAESAQKLLEDLDGWLSRKDRDNHPEIKGTGRYRSGLGIYYFEEPVDPED